MHYELFKELVARIRGYPTHVIVIELAVLWVVVYLIVRTLRGTRGARVIQGLVLILLVATPIARLFTTSNDLPQLNYLYNQFITIAMITIVVVFQPELRRALVRIGEARLFRGGSVRHAHVIDEIVAAVTYLSKNKIGAIIAVEGQSTLDGSVEAGTKMDAVVTQELLNTIFWPGSALHDMAVLIREDRVVAAGVQLPLAEGEKLSSDLGSRHRAAIGLSLETDAVVVVVSEETGIISLARGGKLLRNLTPETLQSLLSRGVIPLESQPKKSDNLAA